MNYKRLTFNGVNDLYLHPTFGARTLENIKEMEEWRTAYYTAQNAKPKPAPRIDVSWEMGMQNERCIEQYGCGMYSPW